MTQFHTNPIAQTSTQINMLHSNGKNPAGALISRRQARRTRRANRAF